MKKLILYQSRLFPWHHVELFLSLLIFCLFQHSLVAQIPQPTITQSLRSDNGGWNIQMRWLHVTDSVRYEVDVALDSNFTKPLPGLKGFRGGGFGYCVDNPQGLELLNFIQRNIRVGTEIPITIFDIPQNIIVYARVQAIHVSGNRSAYSNVVKFSPNNSNLTYTSIRIVRTGETSAYIPSCSLESGKRYTVHRLPILSPLSSSNNPLEHLLPNCFDFDNNFQSQLTKAEELNRDISQRDTILNVPYPTEWSMLIIREQNSLSFKYYGVLPPVSANLAPYIERLEKVSVYEILQPIALSQSSETNLFYRREALNRFRNPFVEEPDTTINNRNIDSLLFRIASRGIPIDTAWFQEGNIFCTSGGCGNYPAVLPNPPANGFNLIIKLRKHDERINEYGRWIRGYPQWRYGDFPTPRRYVFKTQMNVAVAESLQPRSFIVAPNPTQEEKVMIICTLPSSTLIQMEIFTPLGALVLRLQPQTFLEGYHQISLPLSGLSSGAYQVRIRYEADGIRRTVALPLYKW